AGGAPGIVAIHQPLSLSPLGSEAFLGMSPDLSVALLRVFIEARFPVLVENVSRIAVLRDDPPRLTPVINVRVSVRTNCPYLARLTTLTAEDMLNREFAEQLVLVSGSHMASPQSPDEPLGRSHRRSGKLHGRDRSSSVKCRNRKPAKP